MLSPRFQEKNTSLLPSGERAGSQQPCFMHLGTAASFPPRPLPPQPPLQFPSPGAAKHKPLPRSPCRHQQLPGNSDSHAHRTQNSCGDQREPLLPESTRRKRQGRQTALFINGLSSPFILFSRIPNPQLLSSSGKNSLPSEFNNRQRN